MQLPSQASICHRPCPYQTLGWNKATNSNVSKEVSETADSLSNFGAALLPGSRALNPTPGGGHDQQSAVPSDAETVAVDRPFVGVRH